MTSGESETDCLNRLYAERVLRAHPVSHRENRDGLRAAAAFYGPVPPLYSVRKLRAHLLLIHGDQERWMNRRAPVDKKAPDKAGVL